LLLLARQRHAVDGPAQLRHVLHVGQHPSLTQPALATAAVRQGQARQHPVGGGQRQLLSNGQRVAAHLPPPSSSDQPPCSLRNCFIRWATSHPRTRRFSSHHSRKASTTSFGRGTIRRGALCLPPLGFLPSAFFAIAALTVEPPAPRPAPNAGKQS